MTTGFAHEKLRVYQQATEFVGWAAGMLGQVSANLSVYDQLDRSSISVPLNIAEANSRFSGPDRCRFFDNARGSALECAACLDVLVAKGKCSVEQIQGGKEILHQTVSLLVGLIRSISPDRLGEEPFGNRTSTES